MRLSRNLSLLAVLVLVGGLASLSQASDPGFGYETVLDGYYLSRGLDMTVDENGNGYIIASWYQDQQHLDILVGKLGPQGALLWTVTIVGDELEHDYPTDITLDANNDVWITGWTSSESFPIVNGLDDTLTGFVEAFVMKLDSDDGTILYSTFLGGDYTDRGYGITLNEAGEIYVVGSTGSTDFPTTPDAYQDNPSAPLYIYTDAFITKLSAAGDQILYSTYFGGFEDDTAENVALDQDGNIVLAGRTTADDFPLANPIMTTPDGIFISKLSADGSTLQFSTYLGGSDLDGLRGMAMDAEGFVYITGSTRSIDFPTTVGAFQEDFVGDILGCEEGFPAVDINCTDAFVTKLATDGSGIVYGTFLAGSSIDRGSDITVDSDGCVHLVGYTVSTDFPGSNEMYASIFVSKLSADGSSLATTVTKQSSSAGAGHGIALDDAGGVYFTGAIDAPADIYIAKINSGPLTTSVPEGDIALEVLHLGPIFPNPFNPSTSITYTIPAGAEASPVVLDIYDVAGRFVRELVHDFQSGGTYTVSWNGTDSRGVGVASGIYFGRIHWNRQSQVQRMVLVQ